MKVQHSLVPAVTIILTVFFAVGVPPAALADNEPAGLVGRGDFNDGTGKDLSGNGNDAVLGGVSIYSLGEGHNCLKHMPDAKPMRIPASEKSPLAISRGTVCLWLNAAWVDSATVLAYDNDAIQFRYYRRHFQSREELGSLVWQVSCHLTNNWLAVAEQSFEAVT